MAKWIHGGGRKEGIIVKYGSWDFFLSLFMCVISISGLRELDLPKNELGNFCLFLLHQTKPNKTTAYVRVCVRARTQVTDEYEWFDG